MCARPWDKSVKSVCQGENKSKKLNILIIWRKFVICVHFCRSVYNRRNKIKDGFIAHFLLSWYHLDQVWSEVSYLNWSWLLSQQWEGSYPLKIKMMVFILALYSICNSYIACWIGKYPICLNIQASQILKIGFYIVYIIK